MERIRILMSARKQRRNCRRARHTWRKRRGSAIRAVGHGSLLRVTLGTGPRNATACWVLIRKVENRIVHPGGGIRGIRVVGHPVLSPSGDLFEFEGTVIDITERKRAEEELRTSEAHLAEA